MFGTLAIDLEDGAYDYKFALGAWVDQEAVPAACGVSFTLEDGTPGVNRNVVVSAVTASVTLDTYSSPWSGCAAGYCINPVVTCSQLIWLVLIYRVKCQQLMVLSIAGVVIVHR